jgi:hypothetical protein
MLHVAVLYFKKRNHTLQNENNSTLLKLQMCFIYESNLQITTLNTLIVNILCWGYICSSTIQIYWSFYTFTIIVFILKL